MKYNQLTTEEFIKRAKAIQGDKYGYSETEAQKRRAYERQGHKCPCCVKNGIDTEYAYNKMQGDHIIPWAQGGGTIDSNLHMLCQKCNNDKSNQ